MIFDDNIEKLLEDYEAVITQLEAKLKENSLRVENVIERDLKCEDTFSTIESITNYLKLVVMNSSNLATIRDDLKQKVGSMRQDIEILQETEMNLKSKFTASSILIAQIKESIKKLKESNEDIQNRVNSDESPLVLKLFKAHKR